ncbi:hypothetical protein AVEN_6782-1 [Araneus ventricosus]|uniref:Uncharacterized protein n=1 Tax=Araneus ventricosus TaxID=182803 RepID=A0A4Y2M1Q4_ARAVE|nr:hypothetical protein AVEN_6782-1 [Araneus ventricosus]
MNDVPWSVCSCLGNPILLMICNNAFTLVVEQRFATGIASGYLEDMHNAVIIYLFPDGVFGKGPLASMFIFVNISVMTGTILSGAVVLSWGFPTL